MRHAAGAVPIKLIQRTYRQQGNRCRSHDASYRFKHTRKSELLRRGRFLNYRCLWWVTKSSRDACMHRIDLMAPIVEGQVVIFQWRGGGPRQPARPNTLSFFL